MDRRSLSRQGSTLVLICLLLPVLLALSAMAINIAYIQGVNTKVQFVTDAGARAAGRVYATTTDEQAALTAAQNVAILNPIGTVVVPFTSTDIQFGTSTRSAANASFAFTSGSNGNSVFLTTESFSQGSGLAPGLIFPFLGAGSEIRPNVSAINTQLALDITLVVDRSGSMAEPANPGDTFQSYTSGGAVPINSRWIALESAANVFLDELQSSTGSQEQCALVSYSDSAQIDMELSTDFAPIRSQLNGISNSYTGGGTNIGGGLVSGTATFDNVNTARPWASKVIVLLSDGVNGTGPDPLTEAQNANNADVTIYTISFGGSADTVLMTDIANATGGSHYSALDAVELENAFRTIARQVSSLITQ